MPRGKILARVRQPTVTSLTRDLLKANTPVASTSRLTLDSDGSQAAVGGGTVTWLPSETRRSPGKALIPKLPKPKPLAPPHRYHLPREMGLSTHSRRLEPQWGSRNRYHEHFRDTLESDLLYLTYDQHLAENPPPNPAREPRDPLNPYHVGMTLDKGPWEPLIPKARPITPENRVQLQAIHLKFVYLPAYANKTKLLPVVGAMRAISGIQPHVPGEPPRNQTLKILRTAQADKQRAMRVGVAIGVAVTLEGPRMFNFLETLVEVVLPRWRNFRGIPLPEQWDVKLDPHGQFVWKLPAEAVPLFPQLEINADRYPHFADLDLHFVTNSRGPGSLSRTMTLLSGFRLPFVPYFEPVQEADFSAESSQPRRPPKGKQRMKPGQQRRKK